MPRLHLLVASSTAIAAFVLLASCGSSPDQAMSNGSGASNEGQPLSAQPKSDVPGAAPSASDVGRARWDLQSSGEGVALALLAANGDSTLRLFCPAGRNQLLVNVPAFRPIGSEERLSVGSGGEAVALVADTRGDRRRGGVSGTGRVPDGLLALLGRKISATYGAQESGPHPVPPATLAHNFAGACRDGAAGLPADTPTAPASPCLMQDGERLRVTPIRAVGTEPFWSARIEGRCVLYSHPEDQKGTRIWTRFEPLAGGGTWSGALGGRQFELKASPRPGCSDGMSDKKYPLAVDLIVAGERRSGCAEPM